MMTFLRENWLWIAAPIAIFLVLLGLVIWLGSGDSASPFIYNIF